MPACSPDYRIGQDDMPDAKVETIDRPMLGNDLLVTLMSSADERGSLVAIEGGGRDVPFDIARVYFIYGTRGDVGRGFHAHIDLRQLAVCVSGMCDMVLDNGVERRTFRLDDPTKGLMIHSMMWREMRNFSADAVLMVLADAVYDEADYIRSYDEFLARAGAGEGTGAAR